jgi:hypothetical protein
MFTAHASDDDPDDPDDDNKVGTSAPTSQVQRTS